MVQVARIVTDGLNLTMWQSLHTSVWQLSDILFESQTSVIMSYSTPLIQVLLLFQDR
jgi:hypothetical protein